jgi:hypothetical protein
VAVFPEKSHSPPPVWRPRRRLQPTSEYDSTPAPSAPRRAAPADAAPRADGWEGGSRAPAAEAFKDDEAPYKRKGAAAPAPGSGSGGPSNIGTEYGESEGSSVVEVSFVRRSPTHPAVVLRLRYDDFDGLEARGIDLSPLGYAYRYEPEPEPFPYSQSRFASPPR